MLAANGRPSVTRAIKVDLTIGAKVLHTENDMTPNIPGFDQLFTGIGDYSQKSEHSTDLFGGYQPSAGLFDFQQEQSTDFELDSVADTTLIDKYTISSGEFGESSFGQVELLVDHVQQGSGNIYILDSLYWKGLLIDSTQKSCKFPMDEVTSVSYKPVEKELVIVELSEGISVQFAFLSNHD